MNALYLKDRADKTRRGMIAAVLNGAIPGGRTFGYDIVRRMNERGELIPGLRKINQNEAEIVRTVFARYQAGESLRSEEHTAELQSLMRISYAFFCLYKKNCRTTSTLTIATHAIS